jgi:hypothetical protein
MIWKGLRRNQRLEMMVTLQASILVITGTKMIPTFLLNNQRGLLLARHPSTARMESGAKI